MRIRLGGPDSDACPRPGFSSHRSLKLLICNFHVEKKNKECMHLTFQLLLRCLPLPLLYNVYISQAEISVLNFHCTSF